MREADVGSLSSPPPMWRSHILLIPSAADMGMHFANTTKFDVGKAANPASGRDRRADRMKSNADSESRPRAPAVRLQGDGAASVNMLSIGSSSISAAHSLDEFAFGRWCCKSLFCSMARNELSR